MGTQDHLIDRLVTALERYMDGHPCSDAPSRVNICPTLIDARLALKTAEAEMAAREEE